MKKIFLLFSLLFIIGQVDAQTKTKVIKPVCKVYGALQGVSYDAMVKQCKKNSSSEACEEFLNELSAAIGMASLSRKEYVKSNVLGCELILTKVEGGVSYLIQGGKKTKAKLSEIYDALKALDFDVKKSF